MTACICGCTNTTTKTPRPAKQGLLCNGCAGKLRDALEAIPDLYATLSRSLEPARTGVGGGPGNFAENPVPLALGVVAVQDRRNRAAVEKGDVPDVLGVLNGWVECLRDDLAGGDAEPRMHTVTRVVEVGTRWEREITVREIVRVTVVGEVRYLLGAFDRFTERPWVDEALRDIRQAQRALMAVQGIRPPERVGKCFALRGKGECGGALLKTNDGAVECNRCKDRWEGMGMVRLQHVLGGRIAT